MKIAIVHVRAASCLLSRAPVDGLDAPAAQPGGETLRQRVAQVGAVLYDLDQEPADEGWDQAAADGFDLGKLGHGRTLARSAAFRYGSAR